MSKINDGGPVHSVAVVDGMAYMVTTLTVRDWFAGQALAGTMVGDDVEHCDRMGRYCYKMADAMMAEREKAK